MIDALRIDIRHSLRGLRRSPGFSLGRDCHRRTGERGEHRHREERIGHRRQDEDQRSEVVHHLFFFAAFSRIGRKRLNSVRRRSNENAVKPNTSPGRVGSIA